LLFGKVGIHLAHQENNLMETTALTLTSLPSEPATGIQTRIETQPSGEFAKILQSQPAQTEKPSGKNSEGQEEDQLPVTGKEISVLLFSLLPALLPEGQSPSGEKGLGAASSGSQNLGNDGARQILGIPIPEAVTKDGSTAVVQKEMFNGNPSSPLEKSFNLGLPPNESSLPAGSTTEILTPGKGTANTFPAEKARINGPDPQRWHNPEGREELGGDPKNSAKAALANFDSEFSVKGKDLFQNDLDLSDISRPGNPKTGDLFGSLAAPGDRSTGPHPAGEVRLEGTPGSSLPQKAEVYEQISQKMVWSLGQNKEKFRLTLDPPHLGSIYMEIQRDKEQIKATLWAENPNTKQILESNQLSIQKIIETEGFSLESFNVFVEQDLGTFQENRERMNNSEQASSNSTAEMNRASVADPAAPPLFARESRGRLRAINFII
jgi:hypothetical protein